MSGLLKATGQNDRITMQVELEHELKSLKIQQTITYFNRSQDKLECIYLHDWNNAFSDKNTVLGKRFVENYSKRFFFANEKDRGNTKINNISINYQTIKWERTGADILKLILNNSLTPKDSVTIELSYIVKIPNSKFTSYGIDDEVYNLRYWHLIPAVYNKTWQLMHHLNMDDLQQNQTDYSIYLTVPNKYNVASNLTIKRYDQTIYELYGRNQKDIKLFLSPIAEFEHFKTEKIDISTNLNEIEIGIPVKTAILNRQLNFLEDQLGKYPHSKLFINKTSYEKNPLYGINQMPSFLRPYSDTFEWDLRMFKTLSQQYINNSVPSQSRDNTWLRSGVHSYLMMKYVHFFYPELKLLGNLSKLWGIRSYHISKLDFNERYNLTYQYAARSNHDQALTMRSDSLTNFNRLILNKYKAGIGLRYLDEYLGENIVQNAIKKCFKANTNKDKHIDTFKSSILAETNKDVSWFFNDFIKTNKKIDYAIKKSKSHKDSITIQIKNKKNISVPMSLYGIRNDSIQSRVCLTEIDSIKTLTLPKKDIDFWALNYERKIPETNLRNNRVSNRWSLIDKPIRIRWLRDADDPNHTQIFLEPKADYNYYDGIIVASSIKNKSTLRKKIEFSITPAYSIKNQSLTGSFKIVYHDFVKDKSINSYRFGLAGSYFHYQPDLVYRKLTPYAQIFFKRKNLRSVKNRSASLSFTMVDKEVDPSGNYQTEYDKYNVLNMFYQYNNPELIDNLSYFTDVELGSKFGKFSTDIRFRKLTNSNRQFDVRLFAGFFLYNKTISDFFSFGVNRPNDYLFRYRYYGRSESEGIFSQQIIINDGGFKSQIPVGFANQWITSLNTSIGLWRWLEVYNDVGFVKNRSQSVYFVHDKGIRLNFVHNIFEVYFPLHSNNGWEITDPHYEERIRFVFKADFKSIYNFLRRGFL